MKFTIVRPFNWIGPRMDFIPGIDGPSDSIPRVLACFSNVIRQHFFGASSSCLPICFIFNYFYFNFSFPIKIMIGVEVIHLI